MKMRYVMPSGLLLFLICFATTNAAWAIDPLPDQAGFSGFIRPGVGFLDIESNMVAEFAGLDLSADPIHSLNTSNDSESNALFLVPFSLQYTFNNLQTQIFLGSQLTDLARFDFAQQIGVKQKIGGYGLVQGGILFSTIAAEVWKDPYVINQNRSKTDRDIAGVQIGWDKILGSDLELSYTYRSIDIDDERSGVFLGLTAGQRSLLERDGDQHMIEALYLIKLSDSHRLIPALSLQIDDRDGDARANDAYTFELTYSYSKDPLTILLNGKVGRAEYDEINPIYGKKQEDDMYGVGLTALYKNPWDWKLWGSRPIHFYVEGAFFERDADIDFYDEQVATATAGIIIRW